LAHFLRSQFDTDAHVSLTQGRVVRICYSTLSERLARQMQSILLRFGVIAKLSKCSLKDKATDHQSWRLEITDAHSLRQVYTEIRVNPQPANAGASIKPGAERSGTPGKMCVLIRQPANAGDSVWDGSQRQIERPIMMNCRLLRRLDSCSFTPYLGFRALRSTPGYMLAPAFAGWKLAESDVYWDEIVSIEYLCDQQVYDLTIPETHNFVANDICVHNTAFSLNIAQNAATRPHRDVDRAVIGVFSLEMSNEQLVNRLLCSQARVDAHRLRTGYLSKDEWRRLAVAVGELAETKIYLDDTPGISVLEMRAKARRLKNEQKSLDLLIVDYLQLMSGRGRHESRQQEVSQISRELKMLAKELNVPLIALSQLSRAPETRTGSHKPQLSDLRESGSIEQDSDVVMFIYREEIYKPETEKQNIAE